TSRLVNPDTGRKSTEADDVDAYDLILKDKERLLSLKEPVRFLFSHSALREGWDNPNVFVICTLKKSDSTISRRQEVGRGMRLCVNQAGDRIDHPATVHQVNVLTVVTDESYQEFVRNLQKDLAESLSERPRKADKAYFTGKILATDQGKVEVTEQMAGQIYRYLVKQDYVGDGDTITAAYQDAKREGTRAALPPELIGYSDAVFALIDSVYGEGQGPAIEDERKVKALSPNANYEKKEFKELWNRINKRAAYTVRFDSEELVKRASRALESELKVSPLTYTVQAGRQADTLDYDQ